MSKNKHGLILISVLLLLTLNGVIFAFLLQTDKEIIRLPIGNVDIELDSYYFHDGNYYREAELQAEGLNLYSKFDKINDDIYLYVLDVNISEPDDIKYLSNLRIDFIINSSVRTYFRLHFYESIIFTYKVGEKTYESSKTETKFIDFNYNNKFYDNREFDDYFYYKEPVRASVDDDEIIPLTISFIGDYIGEDIGFYDEKYYLKLGIIFEAVQAIYGPKKNWGLELTPWGEEWRYDEK